MGHLNIVWNSRFTDLQLISTYDAIDGHSEVFRRMPYMQDLRRVGSCSFGPYFIVWIIRIRLDHQTGTPRQGDPGRLGYIGFILGGHAYILAVAQLFGEVVEAVH